VRNQETLCGDPLDRDLVCGDKTRRFPERAHAEPRQLIAGEVTGSARIGALRFDRLGVTIGLNQPQHAVDVREIRPVLVKLAFQPRDTAGDLAALLSKCGNDV
jgi:hypothetical protein